MATVGPGTLERISALLMTVDGSWRFDENNHKGMPIYSAKCVVLRDPVKVRFSRLNQLIDRREADERTLVSYCLSRSRMFRSAQR